jgi:2-desacetyl-2-hydroxyethyl bacteriochlorophyllide A dehydrogenase
MEQVILTRPGHFSSRSVAEPKVLENEVLVKIERIGVCGSDFHAFSGKHPAYVYPRVLGHECACTVLTAPENEFGIKVGDRCAIDPYVNCGTCGMCLAGRTNCCERLEVLGIHRDGGMQEFLAVPLRLLYPSQTLSHEELALVETLGIGAHAVARSEIREGEPALVVGAGPIGLATALFAKVAKADVILAEINEERRDFAARLGFDTIGTAGNIQSRVVYDATGNPKVMASSLKHVAQGGKLVFVGLTSDPVTLDDSLFHRKEVTLYSSRNSTGQFRRIIQLLEDGKISVKEWITDRLSLLEVPDKFSNLPNHPGLIKAIVDVPQSTAEIRRG